MLGFLFGDVHASNPEREFTSGALVATEARKSLLRELEEDISILPVLIVLNLLKIFYLFKAICYNLQIMSELAKYRNIATATALAIGLAGCAGYDQEPVSATHTTPAPEASPQTPEPEVSENPDGSYSSFYADIRVDEIIGSKTETDGLIHGERIWMCNKNVLVVRTNRTLVRPSPTSKGKLRYSAETKIKVKKNDPVCKDGKVTESDFNTHSNPPTPSNEAIIIT